MLVKQKPRFIKTRLLSGIVKKKSGNKTVSIEKNYTFKHKKYKKILSISKKYLIHDENNDCNIGDKIEFYYSRPISCKKFYVFYKKL